MKPVSSNIMGCWAIKGCSRNVLGEIVVTVVKFVLVDMDIDRGYYGGNVSFMLYNESVLEINAEY